MAHIKVADYIAQFLADRGIRHVFAIAGGASLHLIHGIAKTPGIDYICPQHEQAGAFAADAYARVTGGMGAAVSTSGPGATNMLTGVAGAYYDSIPVLFLTGQVARFRFRGQTGVRQMGFQETDTVEMFRPVTKYAVQVLNAADIRYELEKACFMATTGRPGPVVIDLPDDLQRELIDPDRLRAFAPPAVLRLSKNISKKTIQTVAALVRAAERPLFILGWGVRLSGGEAAARNLIAQSGIPVALSWAVADMLPAENPAAVGTFGTHGTRYGNFAVQNADLIIAIGARLDTRETGGMESFARGARKVIVDIDRSELGKLGHYGMQTDVLLEADAKAFLENLEAALTKIALPSIAPWRKRIRGWKERYPICPPANFQEKKVNPYVLVKQLSGVCAKNQIIIADTGCAIAWLMQAFEFKSGQRLFHDFNNTAMGWALPASIGASFASGRKQVVCVAGDGSLQMNMQELATVVRHNLPIKLFVLDNQGYSMIQQTQEQWLNSEYEASTVKSGLAFPNWKKVLEAYGFPTVQVSLNSDLSQAIEKTFQTNGPAACVVQVDSRHRVIPQVKYGRPLEDSEPLLPRDEFLEQMIVAPIPVSQAGLPAPIRV